MLAGSVLGLIAQTGALVGSIRDGFEPANLEAVIRQMNFGIAAIVRAGVAAALLACLTALAPSRLVWVCCAIGGAIVCASFAWMGHGAASEGPAAIVHLAADIIHSLAASVWIGALVAFVFLLLPNRNADESDKALYKALHRFSGIGSAVVALIVLTGLINSWFLVGPDRLVDFWTGAYGQVLLVKLAVFAGMLGLAASNRYRLTPALGDALDVGFSRAPPLSALRRSIALETIAAFVVLGLVAWLGTLAPPTAL